MTSEHGLRRSFAFATMCRRGHHEAESPYHGCGVRNRSRDRARVLIGRGDSVHHGYQRAGTGGGSEGRTRTLDGRVVDPKDIAALCVYLASDAGKSISGQVIPIDNDAHQAS